MDDYTGELGQLKPAAGSIKKTKRIGRGRGSGHGDTSTRGDKGAQSRSGYKKRPGFEGGQMPLKRRIPKRGFFSLGKTQYNEINISNLSRIQGDTVDPESIRKAGLVSGRGPIVLLGNGEIDRALTVKVHRLTGTAKEKVTAAGGVIEILALDPADKRVKQGPRKTAKKKTVVPDNK